MLQLPDLNIMNAQLTNWPIAPRLAWVQRELDSIRTSILRDKTDFGEPVSFNDVATRFRVLGLQSSRSNNQIKMSDFASLAYCPIKIWHYSQGTPVVRSKEAVEKLNRGKLIHEKKHYEAVKDAREAPRATAVELGNPDVDIAEIPEFRAAIEHGGFVYKSIVDRVGRMNGNLLVREFKTSNYVVAQDHILQTLGYCVSAPAALLAGTNNHFAAKNIDWSLNYTMKDVTYGPFPFTDKLLNILLTAMTCCEELYVSKPPDVVPGLSAVKCKPCGFKSGCGWRVK